MGLGGLGVARYFGARQLESIEARYKRLRARANDPRIELVDRVDQLEDDFGRALLLLQTLAEVCVAKGVMTREEIAKMAERVDMADGVKDGKLDPAMKRPKQEEEKPPVSPKEHLRQLEEEARE